MPLRRITPPRRDRRATREPREEREQAAEEHQEHRRADGRRELLPGLAEHADGIGGRARDDDEQHGGQDEHAGVTAHARDDALRRLRGRRGRAWLSGHSSYAH